MDPVSIQRLQSNRRHYVIAVAVVVAALLSGSGAIIRIVLAVHGIAWLMVISQLNYEIRAARDQTASSEDTGRPTNGGDAMKK